MFKRNIFAASSTGSARRFTWPALIILLALLLVTQSARAQDGDNWLQAVVNEHVAVESLTGGSPFAATPQLIATFSNNLATGYNLFAVGGDILRPSTPDYCSIVQVGASQPLVIPPAGQQTEIEIVGYCLELPDEAAKPDEAASYLPLNYGGQVSDAVRQVLDKARSGSLERDFATQVAVWQAHTDLTVEELAQRLDQDLTEYAPQLDYLLGDGPLPDPTPTSAAAAAAAEIPTPAAANPTAEDEAIVIAAPANAADTVEGEADEAAAQTIFGVPRTLFWIGSTVIGSLLLLSIVLLALALRPRSVPPARRPARRARQQRTAARQAARRELPAARLLQEAAERTPAVSPARTPLAVGPSPSGTTVSPLITGSGEKCLICGATDHSTRECPEIQRPNQAFVPTEIELTLANVDEDNQQQEAEPQPPEVNGFWEQSAREVQESTRFIEPPSVAQAIGGAALDDEFYEVARMRSKISAEEMPTDTAPVTEVEEEQDETGPVSRKHVTYIIREKGKPDVIGSLGNDGGIISRINLKEQQILLPPKDVSTPHALLRIRPDGRVTIKDLRSKNGTYVYDEAIVPGSQIQIYDGSRLRFGESAEFELDLQQRRLVPLDENGIVRDLSTADQWLITRRNLHSVVVPNNQLSSPHLLIRPSDDVVSEIRLKDLHSHNPTVVGDGLVLAEQEDGAYVESEQIDFRVGKTVYTILARSQKVVDVIGEHWRVVRQLYISKMADVYSVRDQRKLSPPLQAAKVLNIYQEKKEASRRAFELEIELMQRIDNPHILPVDATGHDSSYDAPFFIMPYLDGSDMRRILHYRRRYQDNSGLSLPNIRQIVNAVCSAVSALHAEGYAHCDVKPANIYLTPDGEIYLLDLGVATPLGNNAEFFTQFYSAPEVGAKHAPPVSAASDVYSIGIALLEMLTGLEAKDMSGYATSPGQIVANTEASRPIAATLENLEEWLSKTPAGLDFADVIARATGKAPAERFQTIAEFQQAFDQAFEGERVREMLTLDGDQADIGALSSQSESKA